MRGPRITREFVKKSKIMRLKCSYTVQYGDKVTVANNSEDASLDAPNREAAATLEFTNQSGDNSHLSLRGVRPRISSAGFTVEGRLS